jgi:hypothetical protein
MAISKYTLYKYAKGTGTWRYCKAASHDNGKIKPDIVFVNVKQGLLEKHLEGRYYMSHNGGWIDAGTDAEKRRTIHSGLSVIRECLQPVLTSLLAATNRRNRRQFYERPFRLPLDIATRLQKWI